MNFRIADTFTASLGRLSGEEQKAVKTTAFDLQLDPVNPGMSLHKLDTARDKNFWSVRVSRDIRLIVHKTAGSLLLAYVDHHDDAYRWAERRSLETHPTTGAAQWVEVRERIETVEAGPHAATAAPVPDPPRASKPLFAEMADGELLGWGVPPAWLAEVRRVDEDGLLDVAALLPAEAAEALLTLATGGTPLRNSSAAPGTDPFEHPDAQRRFRVVEDAEALGRALAFPWDRWTVFLHPAQRQWVEKSHGGPARVAGSAGTGKTIVALHRAVHLARTNLDSRIWLTTLTPTLAHALHTRLRRLVGNTPQLAERIDVASVDEMAARLYRLNFGAAEPAGDAEVRAALQKAAATFEPLPFDLPFLTQEWQDVVDAWGIDTLDAYRDVKRLGRRTRLSERQRAQCWPVFESARAALAAGGRTTLPQRFARLADRYSHGLQSPFDHIVVDEAQDLSVPQVRLLAAMAAHRPDGLFFAGDLGQRIFQQPFSWKALGIELRGRSRTLHVNYRTSHQIREQADRLLGPEVSDVDGNVESRRGTVSVFNGVKPEVRTFVHEETEWKAVGQWLALCRAEGMAPAELAVFVRSDAEMGRARKAVAGAGLAGHVLDVFVDVDADAVSIGTMHVAKGLEFRAVAVMACDDEVIPSQPRIETVVDDGDLAEVYASERHLLYVACTRARDRLWVSGVSPASEFMQDLGVVDQGE